MTKKWCVYAAALILSLLTGCTTQKAGTDPSDLLGSWQSGPVKTEWGEAILELTFLSPSEIEFKMTPKGGDDLVTRGKYRIRRGQMVSDTINKGEPVPVWLEDNKLVIREPSEPPQTFRRKQT